MSGAILIASGLVPNIESIFIGAIISISSLMCLWLNVPLAQNVAGGGSWSADRGRRRAAPGVGSPGRQFFAEVFWDDHLVRNRFYSMIKTILAVSKQPKS